LRSSPDTFSGGPITGAMANWAPRALAAIGGGLATDAVGASPPDELNSEVSELAVSHPASPKAINPANSADASGFFFCQAAAASKVVTATLPR
jgi:hypothetical protein